MGTRSSRHNRGRKPLYKEHSFGTMSDDAVLAENERDAISALGNKAVSERGECSRCGGTKFSPYPGLCETCYRPGSAFMKNSAARTLTEDGVRQLSEWAAEELFKQVRWHENEGAPTCYDCDSVNVAASNSYGGRHLSYRCSECEASFTVVTGTPFCKSALSWHQMLLAIVATGRPGARAPHREVIVQEIAAGLKDETALKYKQRTAKESLALLKRNRAPETFEIGKARYVNDCWISTGTTWSEAEQEALTKFCGVTADIEKVANALGRTPTSVVHRAIDSGLLPAYQWRKILPMPKKIIRINDDASAPLLQFPYIRKVRDEHADILAVNELVPKHIPSDMRADIVQEAMLALLEGRITIEGLKGKEGKARWFVSQFYKNNFEQAGHALSLTVEGRDGDEYDRIEASISQDEWRGEQMNEKRNAWDAVNQRFYAPSQIDDVYRSEIMMEQARLHDEEKFFNYGDAELSLEALGPTSRRHLDFKRRGHPSVRLEERYGLPPSKAIFDEMKIAVFEGRVRKVRDEDDRGAAIGWIRVRGKNVRIVYSPEQRKFITVLPPQDERVSYRDSLLENAESYFK